MQAAGTCHGTNGWATLNTAGDRQHADFDFWTIRPSGTGHAWTRVGGYENALGELSW